VYEWSLMGGYNLLWKDGPAVAIPDSHSIRWLTEDELEVSYVNPRSGDVVKKLSLK
jgi:hypothetical protein